jgi:hypothetical protein
VERRLPDFLDVSLARFEPPEEWAPERRLAIDTSETGWELRLVEWLCAPSAHVARSKPDHDDNPQSDAGH